MFAYIPHPAIDPVLLPITGSIAIRWYSLMYLVGMGLTMLVHLYEIRKSRFCVDRDAYLDLVTYIMLGLILGGRVGYVLFYNFAGFLENPLELFYVWQGGMSFHGGVIGGIWLGRYSLSKWKKTPNALDMCDVIFMAVPLALMCGRLGNFINGELWGRPTASKWGMLFTGHPEYNVAPATPLPLDDPNIAKIVEAVQLPLEQGVTLFTRMGYEFVNIPRYPSQLFEMTLEGPVLFVLLYMAYRLLKQHYRGTLFSLFCLGYGAFRFFVEFFREPDGHIGYLFGGWFTMGMLLSTPMIIGGVIGVILSYRYRVENVIWGRSKG